MNKDKKQKEEKDRKEREDKLIELEDIKNTIIYNVSVKKDKPLKNTKYESTY